MKDMQGCLINLLFHHPSVLVAMLKHNLHRLVMQNFTQLIHNPPGLYFIFAHYISESKYISKGVYLGDNNTLYTSTLLELKCQLPIINYQMFLIFQYPAELECHIFCNICDEVLLIKPKDVQKN